MNDELPLSLHRHVKRGWAKSITPLKQITGQVVANIATHVQPRWVVGPDPGKTGRCSATASAPIT
jgi:hypothetical protein